MAGINLEITVRHERVSALMERLARALADMRPVMAEIGEIVTESVQRNFEEERSPDGRRWAPLAPATLRRRRHKGHILVDTATLFKSIHPSPARRSVRVGTDVVYAAVHQFGIGWRSSTRSGRTMPAIPKRPFLGVRRSDWPEIKAAIEAWILGPAS